MAPRVVVIDNYDSFVYILVQYLGELGADIHIHRHDEITVDEIAALEPDAILISPGPGTPDDAGISLQVIKELGPTIPMLGVCLGHQSIGQVFGGDVVRAPTVMHGKTSTVTHNGRGVFTGLDPELTVTRYHSLVVEPRSIPDVLEVTATSQDSVIGPRRARQQPPQPPPRQVRSSTNSQPSKSSSWPWPWPKAPAPGSNPPLPASGLNNPVNT